MKKGLKVLMGAAALLAGGISQAATPTTQTAKTAIEINQKQTVEHKKVKQSREVAPDMQGGLRFDYYDRGRSPKEYGMYLQSTGRQKWDKKR